MAQPRLHEDQVDIDEALARRLLAQQLPAYAHLPLRHVRSGGTDNVVFRLGDDLAVRMPMRPGAADGLRKEVRWLPVIAPHLSLDVPEIVTAGRPSAEYPFPWAVVRWLPGEDALVGRIHSLRDAALTLARFVRELQSIASVPPPGSAGFVRGGPLADRDAGFRAALAQCEELLDVGLIRAIWEDALAAPGWTGPPVWLHADLLPGNLLLRGGRVAGVLDFGAMATGDPAYDVTAAWHVLDGEHRALFREHVQADDATWRRGRGLVVSGGIIALPYYLHTNPSMIATARRGITEVLADLN